MYHTSNPIFRDSILKHGLLPKIGEQRCFGNELLPAAIFLSELKPFYSCYDDDIYEVNIDKEKLLIDNVIDDAYYTLEAIDISLIKLIYSGTGECIE